MKSLSIILLTILSLSSSAGPAIKGLSSSETANGYFQIGFDAASAGQYDTAVKYFTQAIQIDSTRIYFFYHRGLALKALSKKSKAIADFKKCVSIRPLAEANYELGLYKFNDGDMTGAKYYLESARAMRNNIDKLGYYLGVTYYHLGDFDSAEALLDRYIYTVKNHPDSYFYLALVKIKLNKSQEVTPMLQLAGLYNEYSDWTLHYKMYEIYREMHDKENMFYHITMVIELGETKPEYYNIRSKLYKERGESLNASYDLLYASAQTTR